MINDIDNYLKYFLKELELTNKSKHTITAYTSVIKSFKDFLLQTEKEITYANIKKIDILTFLEYKNDTLQKQSEFTNTSKQMYVSTLKKFFTFINENFDTHLKITEIFNFKIKNPKRTPKGIDENDLQTIKNYISTLDLNDFMQLRQSTLLKILLYSGCRCSELREIKLTDFTLVNNDLYSINVIGKGSKERTLYITKDNIQQELNQYKKLNLDYLAISQHKKRLDNSQVYKILTTIFKKLNLKYSGVHIFRHTFAKTMLYNGVSINIVKELLGHSSITTTSIYTNPSKSDIENAYMTKIN